MAYEIYTRKIIRAGSPTLAFSKSGRIMLNKSSTAHLEKNAVEFVLVLWDKDRRRIGIRPITKKDPRAYAVKYAKNNAGSYFSAKTFLDYINANYTESVSFPAVWNDDGVLEAEIPPEILGEEDQQQRLIEIESNPIHRRSSKIG